MTGESIQAEKQKRKELYRNRLKQYAAKTEESRTQQAVDTENAKDAPQDGVKQPGVRKGKKTSKAERDRNAAGWIFSLFFQY